MKRLSVAAAATLLAVGGAVAVAVAAPAGADTQICTKYGSTSIQGGRYIVQNNVWGDDTTQCINVTNTGFAVTSAVHNLPQNGAPAAYPSVYAGCHYGNCTSGSGLPLAVSDSRFATIATSVSMSYPNNGSVYDASYDVWFDPTPRTDGQNTGAELMVWLNKTGSVHAAGSQVGTVNIAGANWDVWYGNYGWNVVSYVRQSPTSSISFNVSPFYRDMVNRGYAQNSWYITSVQAGFEPWVNGTGLAVNNFSYSIGGGSTGSPSPSSTGGGTGGASCRVSYTKSEWPGGFTGNVTVTNTGTSPINGWSLGFSFPGDQHITNAWSATVSQSGSAVTATNVGYNAQIPPGGNTSFGFQGTWNSNDSNPTSFRLNGTACSNG
ncbi:GH12 family glycosyl hydrolase domain-containing protein [Dactylosporangium sp. CA-139066]|uniref:GH12 family glycosyl hydrolase domain-containing protein n=1 Tax=Dactylosporangium sp. CA-139066 TaxID=3239930 RepID=UPI003D8A1334